MPPIRKESCVVCGRVTPMDDLVELPTMTDPRGGRGEVSGVRLYCKRDDCFIASAPKGNPPEAIDPTKVQDPEGRKAHLDAVEALAQEAKEQGENASPEAKAVMRQIDEERRFAGLPGVFPRG